MSQNVPKCPTQTHRCLNRVVSTRQIGQKWPHSFSFHWSSQLILNKEIPSCVSVHMTSLSSRRNICGFLNSSSYRKFCACPCVKVENILRFCNIFFILETKPYHSLVVLLTLPFLVVYSFEFIKYLGWTERGTDLQTDGIVVQQIDRPTEWRVFQSFQSYALVAKNENDEFCNDQWSNGEFCVTTSGLPMNSDGQQDKLLKVGCFCTLG